MLNRVDCPAKNGVHLDLNHGGFVLDHELGVSHLVVANLSNGEACFVKAVTDLLEPRRDCAKGLGSRECVIDKDEIEVDGETWHVPHKEINGCATLESKEISREHVGGNPEQEPDGIDVGFIHA